MCKPSCCPGTNSSGLTAAVLIVLAAIAVASAADPIAHAATAVLHAVILIALITFAALAGLAALAAVVLLIRRTRRLPSSTTRPGTPVAAVPASFALTAGERARCAALGADPAQAAQFIAAVLGGPQ